MTRAPLEVWLYGTRIATVAESADRRLRLAWEPEALDRWGPGARVLSAMMPIGTDPVPPLVTTYLDGLLPEGNARVNHAMGAAVPPDDTFALVRAYGRDTPGAAIFVPEGSGDPTRQGRYEPLTPDQVADRLRHADDHSPAGHDGQIGESSTLPGMVPKITLHRDGDQWFACKDGAASTWIVKRASAPASGLADVVDTEAASLALARMVGITSISAEIIEHDGVRAIAVSRYDRHDSADDPRLHQEDLAQAIGLNTQDPNRKFQWGSRMPSLKHAADVLRLDGGNLDSLLRLTTFSYLVGNTDMHAKNISFLRHRDGSVALAPAYDIAMHLHHPRDNRRSALDVNGTFLVKDIGIEDVVAEGRAWRLPPRRSQRIVADTATAVAEALETIDRNKHPGVSQEAWAVVEERTSAALVALAARSRPSPTGRPPAAVGTEDVTARAATRRGPRRPR